VIRSIIELAELAANEPWAVPGHGPEAETVVRRLA